MPVTVIGIRRAANESTVTGILSPEFKLDEREFFYDWKIEDKFLGCDYITFSF